MEETIGYEALFSREEWDSLELAEEADGGADDRHGVTIWYPPGEFAGNEARHELECKRCGYIGAADGADEAEVMARLHESFVATLVESWSVER
ncbi:MAG: hypothetical protein M3N53_13305 [Actinomycetota bacterium]|nr:hypothetical protein [Actinomycetota bacterium]